MKKIISSALIVLIINTATVSAQSSFSEKSIRTLKATVCLAAPSIILNGIKPNAIPLFWKYIFKKTKLFPSSQNSYRITTITQSLLYSLLATYFWSKAFYYLSSKKPNAKSNELPAETTQEK